MVNHVIIEFKKAFCSIKFIFTLFIGFICLCVGGVDDIAGNFTVPIGSLYLFAQSYSSGFYSIFLFLAPLICSIPYALSYIEDYENGEYKRNIDTIGNLKYFVIKFCVNGIVGGLSLALIIIFYYICILMIKGVNPNDIMNFDFNNSLTTLINKNQHLYILVESIFSFIFGFTFANITLSISIFTRDKWITLSTPIFFHVLSFVVLSNITPYLDSLIIYSFFRNSSMNILPRIIYTLFINISCILVSIFFIRKNYIGTEKNIRLYKLSISFFIIIVIKFQFQDFLELYNYNERSLFSFLLFLFNNLYIFHYFISFCFIIFISNILKKDTETINNNIKTLFVKNIKKIVSIILKFLIFFIISSILIYIFNKDIKITNNRFYSDILLIIFSIILMTLYLFTISLICITTNSIFKSQILSIVIISFIIVFNISIYIGDFNNIKPFSIVYNSLFSSYTNSNYIIPIIFWILLIAIISNIYLNYSKTID